MANRRVLVINSGIIGQISPTDTADVGVGIYGAGDIAITAAGGDVVIQAGTTLSTTGTGNINLPNNGSAKFLIEGVAVSANVTAANLNTLTAGSSSNADALHTHAGSSTIVVSGTSGEALTIGDLVSVKNDAGTAKFFKADANGTQDLKNVVGVAASTVGAGAAISVINTGEVSLADANWDVAPVAADAGSRAYLSTTAGKWTLTAPNASGDFTIRVGVVSQKSVAGVSKAVMQIGEGVLN